MSTWSVQERIYTYILLVINHIYITLYFMGYFQFLTIFLLCIAHYQQICQSDLKTTFGFPPKTAEAPSLPTPRASSVLAT
jgi:hypothetical protein